MENNKKISIISSSFKHNQENTYIYKKIDGRYYSYWLGKFFNFFIRKGKKSTAYKHLYMCFLLIKITKNITPLLYWFEILEHIKPTFKLISIFPQKRMIIYPRVIVGNKQYNIALRWLREIIEVEYSQTRKSKMPFYRIIVGSFEYLDNSKNKPLLKKRDNYLNEAIRLQDHIRFTWVEN